MNLAKLLAGCAWLSQANFSRSGNELELNEIRTAISSDNIQLLQSYIATYREKLEEVIFVEEEFLYKKISKKDVYVDYGATADGWYPTRCS